MSAVDPVALLAGARLFEGLDRRGVERLAARASVRTLPRHADVFRQGDEGDALYVVVEGMVKVFVTSLDGEEMVLVTLGAGETFGELSAIDGGPRSASARTLRPTTLVALSRTALLEALVDQPSLTEGLLRSLGSVVRRLTDQACDLVFLDLHGRVAKLLLSLCPAAPDGTAGSVDLDLSQGELASMVGGSRQSVNQILRSFAALGYVDIEGRHVVVRRPDLLRRRAGVMQPTAGRPTAVGHPTDG